MKGFSTMKTKKAKTPAKTASAPFFRCLCVKSPYAGRIVDGKKTEEYRSTATRIRGKIGIIESGTGTIIGEAELFDCTKIDDWEFVWHLRNAKRYKKPRPYVHPFGAVIWVKVPENGGGK